MDNTIYLLLGSNIGNREDWLEMGRNAISNSIGRIGASSAIYETAAWGKENQQSFLNQVVEVISNKSAREILTVINRTETATAYRVRIEKWGSRTLDIDLLFYGQEIINQLGLQVPHPAIEMRRFTLVPLSELAPDLIHPKLGKTINTLLEECTDTLEVKLFF